MIMKFYLAWAFIAVQHFVTKAYLIGEPCKYDEDCFVEHSYCEMQQICECKENFIETEDRETCIAMVGAICHSKYDCSSLPNSVCKEDRCVCDTGYVPDAQNSKCMPVTKHLEGPCEHDIQCRVGLGSNSHCIRGQRQCSCKHGYHFDDISRFCLQDKGLGHICSNSSECYIGDNSKNIITCLRGHCGCKEGYHEDEGHKTCISGGPKGLIFPKTLLILCSTILLLKQY